MKACSYITAVIRLTLLLRRGAVIYYCGFKSAKAKVIAIFTEIHFFKFYSILIAITRKLVYLRSARVTETENTRNLIKCLTCCVIPCLTENFILCIIMNMNNMTVTSGCDKSNKRRFKIRMLNKICAYVTSYVMYGNKRFIKCHRQRFCSRNTNKQRSDESRSICDGNIINVFKVHCCVINSLPDNRNNCFKMLSGCYLGHNTAEFFVYIYL